MSERKQEKGSRIVIIVLIAVVLLAGLGAGWYWGFYLPEQEAKEKARLEQLAREAEEAKAREEAKKRKDSYNRFIKSADEALGAKDWENARSSYVSASALFPNEDYPKEQLTIVNATIEELEAIEARKAAGVVEEISSPDGRSYIIISSSLDGDLAKDYAKKLTKQGFLVKLIGHKVHELDYMAVSIGDYATWDEATSSINILEGFPGAWVLKN